MKSWLLAALFALPAIAGCLGTDPETDGQSGPSSILATINLPEGAELVEEAGAIVATWTGALLPFEASFELPEGATMVRFVADPGNSSTVSVAMSHDDTGRRRCNQQSVAGFGQPLLGARSCSSIAAIDPPGTNWTARAAGTGNIDARIEFHHTPLQGPAGNVDWSKLSHADHDLHPTQGMYIDAHDGAQLWVEVTLPQGEGPWPTVIAASPYNGQSGRIPDSSEGTASSGTPAMWTYWTQDYAKRGYAAVNIDVRGFGKSGGCVEVWGNNEQLDQKLIVDWVADQPWSDGHVGFYGQSYVATTPVAAAVQAPEALKAIIAVAPVIDSYHDWHYGGVPNGESSLSPVAYQALVDMAGANYAAEQATSGDFFPTDLVTLAQYASKGFCDPSLIPLANDPRAIHSAFYDERDFGARAGQITAAVLYTQGFEDANVKGAMINDWFNDIQAPKLGVFGHWLHQHPARMDAEALFLGWMDEHVKGKDLGLAAAYPNAIITPDASTERLAEAWPPVDADSRQLWANFDANALSEDGGNGMVDLQLVPASALMNAVDLPPTTQVVLEGDAPAGVPFIAPDVALRARLDGENAMVYAELREIKADGSSRLLTWGMKNLALGDDYDTYEAKTPGVVFEDRIPLRPTELIVDPSSRLQLILRGVDAGEAVGTAQPQPGILTLLGEGTYLNFPLDESHPSGPIPFTALP